jgi:hypothetical protein
MQDVPMHDVGVHDVGVPGEASIKCEIFSLVKTSLWGKTPVLFNYMWLHNCLQIRTWSLIENLKTTLPTHPDKKTSQLMPLLTPLYSRETLPLSC